MSTEPFTIRTLGFADLPQVVAIERRAFPSPWSLSMFVLELSKPSSVCLATVDGRDRLTGYLICSRYADVWHLMNVAVDPPARRRGLGAALLGEMVERAGRDASYTLEVRPSNAEAIALYERYGFRAAGTRRHYYHDTGEDAMVMWRTSEATSTSSAPR